MQRRADPDSLWPMRRLLLLWLLVAGCASAPEAPRLSLDNATALRVMSFNIRYDNPEDGPHAWQHRRELVRQVIAFHDVHLLGVQEALDEQVRQLAHELGDYDWFGVGRSDGKVAGEYAPIFYRRDRLELLEGGTFWVSETPDAPGSRGWDAALPRIATWARLRDRLSGEMFLAMNTHFDHVGEEARRQGARLIVRRARGLAGELPIVLTGDFNAQPDSVAYQTLTEALTDARVRSEAGHFGPEGTFGSFEPQAKPAPRVDYIFLSPQIAVLREGTLAHHWDGRHASDHWPVIAEIRLGP